VSRSDRRPQINQNHPEKFKHTSAACAQILANQSFRFSMEFLPPTGWKRRLWWTGGDGRCPDEALRF
jgi:hypothetical protein